MLCDKITLLPLIVHIPFMYMRYKSGLMCPRPSLCLPFDGKFQSLRGEWYIVGRAGGCLGVGICVITER